MNRKRWTLNLTPLLFIGALGCAHTQTSSTNTSEANPAAVAPAKSAPAEIALSSSDARFSGEVLHFDYDAAALSSDSQQRLQQVADVLRKDSQIKVRISGNCDERGTEEYNLALGQRRAAAAKQYLIRLGVPERRIEALTYGHERPVDPGHNESAWAANRRDEIEATAAR